MHLTQPVSVREVHQPDSSVDITVAGAGSPALRAVLDGPIRTGTVVHAGRQAVYVDLALPGTGGFVGILARDAVQVPCGIATTLGELPDIPFGTAVTVGDGRLHTDGLDVRISRLVSFAMPRLDDAAVDRLLTVPADLSPARRQLPADALARLGLGDPAAVPDLVGRGDGLTPVGDDVLAGWLVAARALGTDTGPVAEAVHAHLHRTTGLSAALLRHAVAGDVIAPFRTALTKGDAAAVGVLLSVGHTSGAGMLLGAQLALTPTHEVLEGSTR